jgi:hypothetical protein
MLEDPKFLALRVTPAWPEGLAEDWRMCSRFAWLIDSLCRITPGDEHSRPSGPYAEERPAAHRHPTSWWQVVSEPAVHDRRRCRARERPPQSEAVKGIHLVSTRISGAVRVVLKGITVDVPGHETTVAIDGECAEITVDGDYRKYCADQLVKDLNAGPLRDKPLTAEESAALRRLARGVANVSVDAVLSDGK